MSSKSATDAVKQLATGVKQLAASSQQTIGEMRNLMAGVETVAAGQMRLVVLQPVVGSLYDKQWSAAATTSDEMPAGALLAILSPNVG